MDPRFKRATSPGSSRLARPPGRSSTGTLVYPSAFDPYDRPSHSSINFGSGPRTSGERVVAPRVVPRYRQHSPHKTSSRDDYVIRPRRLTLDLKPVPTRRPLSVVAPISTNQRPIVTSAVEGPSSSLNKVRPRREEDFYIQPASSRAEHRGSYSASSIDTGRLGSREHDPRERTEQGGYRKSRRTVYDVSQPLVVKPQNDDSNYGYEYTTRDGPIYRDAQQRRSRRESYSGGRERPINMTGLDDYGPRIPQPNRDAGPPVTTRGFANLGRSGSLRQNSRARDDEPASREYARDNQDLQSPQKSSQLVSLHQPSDDEYSRPRHPKLSNYPERTELKPRDPHDDDYGRSRQYSESRHRRDTGSWDERDRRRDDPSKFKHDHGDGDSDAAAKSNIAGLTDAGDGGRRRHRHHHHHNHSGHGRDSGAEINHVHEHATTRPKSESLNLNTEGSGDKDWESRKDREDREDREPRESHDPHNRRRRQLERDAKSEEAHDRVSQQLALPAPLAPSNELRGKSSYDRERPAHENGLEMEEASKSESHRHRRHHSRTSDKDSYSDDSSSSSSSEESDVESASNKKERQVRVVSPARESPPPDPPIKGILRPPRPSFPEDPAPVREGVAPLKGAGKKGIPANARWTKIDRRLVNPEALERGKERFEVKPDSVIVLRVLTIEEIQSYAAETAKIREERMLTLTSGHESH